MIKLFMIVTAIKTHKITTKDKSLFAILDKYITSLEENSVVAVTSKIVAICEGRIVPIEQESGVPRVPRVSRVVLDSQKDQLIKQESQFFLPRNKNKYNVSLTITNDILSASAGIDESNANGYYVLWPKDPQKSANEIRKYLQKKFSLKNIGVIITDSKTTPMRWGVTGIAISHSGFLSLNDNIGKPDLFGRPIEHTMINVMDSLAGAATYVMGERKEQTPIAIIEDIPHIVFRKGNPTKKELDKLKITMEDDLYGEFLKKAEWEKGSSK